MAGWVPVEDVAVTCAAPGSRPGVLLDFDGTLLDVGLSCIALACGGISRAELVGAGADEVYDGPADLLARLEDPLVGRLARGRGQPGGKPTATRAVAPASSTRATSRSSASTAACRPGVPVAGMRCP